MSEHYRTFIFRFLFIPDLGIHLSFMAHLAFKPLVITLQKSGYFYVFNK